MQPAVMWMDPNAGVSEQVSEHLQVDRRTYPHLLGAEQEVNFIGTGMHEGAICIRAHVGAHQLAGERQKSKHRFIFSEDHR